MKYTVLKLKLNSLIRHIFSSGNKIKTDLDLH